jgi:hypothetical protein
MVFDGGEGGEDVCIATIADNGLPSQAGRWRGIDAGDVYARTRYKCAWVICWRS